MSKAQLVLTDVVLEGRRRPTLLRVPGTGVAPPSRGRVRSSQCRRACRMTTANSVRPAGSGLRVRS